MLYFSVLIAKIAIVGFLRPDANAFRGGVNVLFSQHLRY